MANGSNGFGLISAKMKESTGLLVVIRGTERQDGPGKAGEAGRGRRSNNGVGEGGCRTIRERSWACKVNEVFILGYFILCHLNLQLF